MDSSIYGKNTFSYPQDDGRKSTSFQHNQALDKNNNIGPQFGFKLLAVISYKGSQHMNLLFKKRL